MREILYYTVWGTWILGNVSKVPCFTFHCEKKRNKDWHINIHSRVIKLSHRQRFELSIWIHIPGVCIIIRKQTAWERNSLRRNTSYSTIFNTVPLEGVSYVLCVDHSKFQKQDAASYLQQREKTRLRIVQMSHSRFYQLLNNGQATYDFTQCLSMPLYAVHSTHL